MPILTFIIVLPSTVGYKLHVLVKCESAGIIYGHIQKQAMHASLGKQVTAAIDKCAGQSLPAQIRVNGNRQNFGFGGCALKKNEGRDAPVLLNAEPHRRSEVERFLKGPGIPAVFTREAPGMQSCESGGILT